VGTPARIPGAAGVLDLDPGPETGGPGASSGAGPRQSAMAGYAAAEPAAAVQAARVPEGAAAWSVRPLFRYPAE